MEEKVIQWYPGHMAKARRQMEEQLKTVDIIIELRDARMPLASGNPELTSLAKDKARLILLNKADKADPAENKKWLACFEHVLLCDSLNENQTKRIVAKVQDICKDKLEKAKARGIRKKVLRAMIVGIPNVGKSTLINNIVKKKVAKTENRPGVTKNLQWISINEDLELLDTPGVLWPKIEDQRAAKCLALLGSINDDILDREELVFFGLSYIRDNYPGLLEKRYGISEKEEDLVNAIGKAKLWLSKEGETDLLKTRDRILTDIRNDKIGKITYESAKPL